MDSEGVPIGSFTNDQQVSTLGIGWEVKDDQVLPIMQVNSYSKAISNPIFYNATITASAPINITPGLNAGTEGDASVTFIGTYDPVEIGTEGDHTKLYFSNDNTLYWPNGAMTINPFRAYIQLNGASAAATRGVALNFGEEEMEMEVTEVREVQEVREDIDDSWYTINGVKLDGKPGEKGMYIHKGRKLIIDN